jgi:precorrin-8X/cobalt-precorrin-8 methylmutase
VSRAAGDFDEAIVVDWSAAATPTRGADSCWIARGSLRGSSPIRTTNAATRHEAMAQIDRLIDAALAEQRRVLVAIDVSFGLPAGAAAVLQLEGSPGWRALWSTLAERIVDDEHNRNNRFAVADALNQEAGVRCFWGRPIAAAFDGFVHLPIRDVPVEGLLANPLPRLRRCERLAGAGVISNWMLVGKGAVGGQMLTCLPRLEALRRRLGDRVAVWPFDGIGDPGADVVLAETWHGLFAWRAERDRVRDEAQVRATLRAIRQAGVAGRAALLAPESLTSLDLAARDEICAEEGWTLGIA